MKISVITVCLNASDTIERTIRSVVNQRIKDLEYIIIDGGSDDGTLDIIYKYKDKISLIISEADEGLYDAMNKGIEFSTGEVVAILNSDDWYENDTLLYVQKKFCDKNVQILCAGMYYWNKELTEQRKVFVSEESCASIWYEMPAFHPATFVRKRVYDIIGRFDIRYKVAADYEWFLRAHNGGFIFTYTDKITTNFTAGGISQQEVEVCVEEGKTISLAAAATLFSQSKLTKKEYLELCERIIEKTERKENIRIGKETIAKKQLNEEDIKFLKNIILPKFKYSVMGIGKNGHECISLLEFIGKEVIHLYDNNPKKWGLTVMGKRITSPVNASKSEVPIIISSCEDEIVKQLKQKGMEEETDYICYSSIREEMGKRHKRS